MANTYELITSATVGSTAVASVTLSSIPSTYTDLLIVTSARINNAGSAFDSMAINVNGTTGNWSQIYLLGDGGSASSGGQAYGLNPSKGWMGYAASAGGTANTFSNNVLYFPNYAGSTYKSVSIDSAVDLNQSSATLTMLADLWSSTAAIDSITFTSTGGNFVQYSTFYAYGIKNS